MGWPRRCTWLLAALMKLLYFPFSPEQVEGRRSEWARGPLPAAHSRPALPAPSSWPLCPPPSHPTPCLPTTDEAQTPGLSVYPPAPDSHCLPSSVPPLPQEICTASICCSKSASLSDSPTLAYNPLLSVLLPSHLSPHSGVSASGRGGGEALGNLREICGRVTQLEKASSYSWFLPVCPLLRGPTPQEMSNARILCTSHIYD